MTSWSVAGAAGILPNSIAPSRACSPAFCSVTNVHARSFALRHLVCGLRSALPGGKAFSTLIVVANSRSAAPRNCSFSVMAASVVIRESTRLDDASQLVEARGPTGFVLPARLVVGEQLVREHQLRAGAALQELDRNEGFARSWLVLPAPGIHELLRWLHHAVHAGEAVCNRAVRRPHVDAVLPPGPQVDLGQRRGHVARRLPLLPLFRDRPRPEDPLPRRRERAVEPEGDRGDGGLPLSGSHEAVSWVSGWARW